MRSIPTVPDSRGSHPSDSLRDPSLFRDRAFVDGAWISARRGDVLEVTRPADGQVFGTVPRLSAVDVREAIRSAEAAFNLWRAQLASERAATLRRWYELVVAHSDDLAQIIHMEEGKPLAEAKAEIEYGAAFIEWYAEEARRVYGDTIPQNRADRRILVTKEPVGVCAAITPWNFPVAMVTRKAAPALAAGCSIVIKPASETPYSALALAVLAERAGVPKGVLNVVTGSAKVVGGELTAHPSVRKLSFTGSTAVGSLLMSQCAATVKRVSLELGGNAAFIVFQDADLDAAVQGAIVAKFRNCGQSCVGANRFYVHDSIYDEFAARFAHAIRAQFPRTPGSPDDIGIGPMINAAAAVSVENQVKTAIEQGAHLALGGSRYGAGGAYFEPTVLTNVTASMSILQEEIFGPVAPLVRFSSDAEVIAMANETPFGLASYFYTRDLARAVVIAEALECGMVGVNTGLISNAAAPFGGVKQSGMGREGSKYGLDDYLEVKYVCLGQILMH